MTTVMPTRKTIHTNAHEPITNHTPPCGLFPTCWPIAHLCNWPIVALLAGTTPGGTGMDPAWVSSVPISLPVVLGIIESHIAPCYSINSKTVSQAGALNER